ncbi:phosphotransferase family protein [Winogradskya humida]|uniref:Aminoglycoside phosphotransferase domain-containing protein n=1 Tax=Winogradskya humida TaxID=113566 RepID=A0ABQ3ZG81_9ACTN|nr:phosphotransferase [Actinoplanes humidus]GIE17581.1 hypothetical protein Ahu01nite_006830 [Actinoplanes humidus]
MQRTDWEQLSEPVRAAIEVRTGPVRAASTVSAGKNSAIAAVLETATVSVFIKGLRVDDPRVAGQVRESVVSPYVRELSPKLFWRTEVEGWSLLGFQVASGRHANYAPGSLDIPKVVDAIRRLAQIRCPDLPELKRAETRWAGFVDTADLPLLRGDTLLHTDYAPDNILIDGSNASLIDWAWPTLGAAFIDPGCLIIRLIFAGHTPEEAERCVAPTQAWRSAAPEAIDVCAAALAGMWAEIAETERISWKQQMAESAAAWHAYRRQPQRCQFEAADR